MATDKQTREAIFNSFSDRTQGIFAAQKNNIFDNSKAFSLIHSMQIIEKNSQKKESIMNQKTDEKEFVSSGVSVQKDPKTGRLVAEVLKMGV